MSEDREEEAKVRRLMNMEPGTKLWAEPVGGLNSYFRLLVEFRSRPYVTFLHFYPEEQVVVVVVETPEQFRDDYSEKVEYFLPDELCLDEKEYLSKLRVEATGLRVELLEQAERLKQELDKLEESGEG